MTDQKKDIIKAWPVYLVFIVLIALISWAMVKQNQQKQQSADQITPTENTLPDTENAVLMPDNAPTLMQIIAARKDWNPIWTDFYGKPAPNFEFRDIDGKEHRIADYKGKNILVLFWGTYCPPCNAEIPDLIELRNQIGPDKLAMFAISSEPINVVKPFAKDKKLNYTVAAIGFRPPAPFDQVRYIPSACVIDTAGNIKIATEGVVSLTEFKAIIAAQKVE